MGHTQDIRPTRYSPNFNLLIFLLTCSVLLSPPIKGANFPLFCLPLFSRFYKFFAYFSFPPPLIHIANFYIIVSPPPPRLFFRKRLVSKYYNNNNNKRVSLPFHYLPVAPGKPTEQKQLSLPVPPKLARTRVVAQ